MDKINDLSRRSSYLFSTQLFLRSLGAIYLIAFISLWVQIDGLAGSDGLMPIESFLARAGEVLGAAAYWRFPTLCWFASSDGFLHLLCGGGTLAALYAAVFPFAWWVWLLLWGLYLSLTVAGQTFLNFQWDAFLLEVGFLSVFLAPFAFRPRWRNPTPPSRLVLWIYRWLLFRFMLLSGLVKIASQDPVWLDFTALEYHYMTQPLPPWTAWYIHQFPAWFHKASCGLMFFTELVVPFFIFAPRFFRLLSAVFLIGLQLVIIVTGNYGFFNLLAAALCLFLVDDHFWDHFWDRAILRRIAKRKSREALQSPHPLEGEPVAPSGARPRPPELRRWARWALLPILGLLFVLSLPPTADVILRTCGRPVTWPDWVQTFQSYFRPFRTVNGYGLFADMTEERPEIVIEGSDDGETWKAYVFKYKPGELTRAPSFVAPYMPRLDWQMWFAALDPMRARAWFGSLCRHLLLGTPEVLELLGENPFPDGPPRLLRATLYRYDFTSPEEEEAGAMWWKREHVGTYFGPAALRER